MRSTKTPKEIDKLYNDGQISLNETQKLRDEWKKLSDNEKEKLLLNDAKIEEKPSLTPKEIEEKPSLKNIFWVMSAICWFAISFNMVASDFIEDGSIGDDLRHLIWIILNMISPAIIAIIATWIISLFTKRFSAIGLFAISFLILILNILPKPY